MKKVLLGLFILSMVSCLAIFGAKVKAEEEPIEEPKEVEEQPEDLVEVNKNELINAVIEAVSSDKDAKTKVMEVLNSPIITICGYSISLITLIGLAVCLIKEYTKNKSLQNGISTFLAKAEIQINEENQKRLDEMMKVLEEGIDKLGLTQKLDMESKKTELEQAKETVKNYIEGTIKELGGE